MAESAGLLSRCTSGYRGFESRPLRHFFSAIFLLGQNSYSAVFDSANFPVGSENQS